MAPVGRWAWAALLLLGCSGGEPQGPNQQAQHTENNMGPDAAVLGLPDAGSPTSRSLGPNPLRRLTNFEYRNTLADLLGDRALVEAATASLLSEPESSGFRNGAEMLGISPLLAQTYLDVAVRLSQAIPDIPELVPCDVDSVSNTETCARRFVEQFGRRVYRRALTQEEVGAYAQLYAEAVSETGSFRSAIEWLGAAMLTSTPFLFRVELPSRGDQAEPIGGFEAASRLSYLLWQSAPDEALLDAAEQGQLNDPEQLASQVARMLRDPKAFRIYEFFEQWLDLDELASITRDVKHYPELEPNLIALLAAESQAFIGDLLAQEGTFQDLVAGQFTFANRALASHYGLNDVPSGSEFQRVEAPGRLGVLTQAMLLIHDRPDRSSIVRRGVKLRTDLLCLPPPPPPEDVDLTLPAPDGSVSQRERLEKHREDPACAGCHALVDPIGSLFEQFDALGRPRTTDELGHPVQTTASVVGAGDLDGTYEDALDFANALATSRTARDCFVQQAFRFFFGRKPTTADAESIESLKQSFARRGYRLVDLIVGLTRTEQFLFKPAPQEDSP